MKKQLFLAFAALCTASFVASAVEVDAPLLSVRRKVPLTWCSLGTSITWYNDNVGASGGRFTKGYQTRVMEQVKFSGFINKGVNGGCVNSAIWSVVPADFYTIEHGINDWGHSTKPGTLADYTENTGNNTFAANYRKVIDNIRKANPKAKIILCTPRKGYGFGDYLPSSADEAKNGIYLKEYADIVRKIAKKEGFEVADFFATCGESSELKDLSIEVALHPNDAGYQRMANELVKAILRTFPDAKEIIPGQADFTDDGKPKSVRFDKFLTNTPQVVLQGVDVNKVTVEAATLNGAWFPGTPMDASIRFLRRDKAARKTVCQLQGLSTDTATRSLMIELAQDESDVTARIVWGRFSWTWPVGTDFDKEGYDGGAGVALSQDQAGYGVGSITFGINKPDLPSALANEATIYDMDVTDTPSVVPGDLNFNAACLGAAPRVVLKGVNLADVDLVAADMVGAWVPGCPFECSIFHVNATDGGKHVVCQAQVRPPDACTRCIFIELFQSGPNVAARLLKAKYILKGPEPGLDFNKTEYPGAPLASSIDGIGYGISTLTFKKK